MHPSKNKSGVLERWEPPHGLRYNSRRMAKAALTVIDLLLMLGLSALALHEFLSIQLGVSPYLPN